MRRKSIQLNAETSSEWAALAQYRFLDALMSNPQLKTNQIVFHGGTSLHFSWRSPRLSEDLDFLLSRDTGDIQKIIERAKEKTEEAFTADDAEFVIEIINKTKDNDRMPVYNLIVSHPGFIGKTMIKVEFWKVDARYLKEYPTQMRSPIKPGDIVSRVSNPVPAATLETAYCDKLTAFATRPFLKWRDIFDLWWIATQTDSVLELKAILHQFLHNVSAYNTIDNVSPAQALRMFLQHDEKEILKKADPDLKRWIPENLWNRLHPETTLEMVRYARYAIAAVADAIEYQIFDASLKRRMK